MKGLASEIMLSLKDHLEWKEGNSLQRVEEPGPVDVWPSRKKTPSRRRDTSAKRDLTKAREADQRALATVATLEEKIEQLRQSTTWGQSDVCGHSWRWDHCRRSQVQNRWCHQVWPEEDPSPFFQYSLPQRGPGSEEEEEAELPLLDVDLEDLPELGPEVDHFLQESAWSLEEENRDRSSREPPVEEYKGWVTWRAQVHDTPSWWKELAKVPEIKDHQELARKVRASFELSHQISKQHNVENYHQAPPALLCICQKYFLPQSDPKFAS